MTEISPDKQVTMHGQEKRSKFYHMSIMLITVKMKEPCVVSS
jgi:hypothetical protein